MDWEILTKMLMWFFYVDCGITMYWSISFCTCVWILCSVDWEYSRGLCADLDLICPWWQSEVKSSMLYLQSDVNMMMYCGVTVMASCRDVNSGIKLKYIRPAFPPSSHQSKPHYCMQHILKICMTSFGLFFVIFKWLVVPTMDTFFPFSASLNTSRTSYPNSLPLYLWYK